MSPFFIQFRHAPLAILMATSLTLGGCGGNDGSPLPVAKRNVRAERDVVAADLPDLQQCMGNLRRQLNQQPIPENVSLACLEGTLRGTTADGSTCALQVDADTGVFRFEHGREAVSIRREVMLQPAIGPAVFNLQDASAQSRSGVQLTRFVGGAVPVTETIAVRTGGGRAALPTVTYQRTADGHDTVIDCRFGK